MGDNYKNKLLELRKENKLTLKTLSEQVDIPIPTLNNYEKKSREPKLETWKVLADYFDVSIPYIMGLESESVKFDAVKEDELDGLSIKELKDLARRYLHIKESIGDIKCLR